jgi:hypothetical protein
MKKPPEAYWSLFKVIQERTTAFITRDLDPELLNPVFGLPRTKDAPKRLNLRQTSAIG